MQSCFIHGHIPMGLEQLLKLSVLYIFVEGIQAKKTVVSSDLMNPKDETRNKYAWG